MTATKPTRKDVAEFFRLSLLAGLSEPSAVVRWADSIVATESSPHIAFIELCVAASLPASSVQSLLNDVPGQATPELPVRMLIGHSAHLASSCAFTPEQLLLRLYGIASLELFPERIYFELDTLEDECSLARDRVYGTPAEVAQDITTFLNEYEQYAPDNSTGVA